MKRRPGCTACDKQNASEQAKPCRGEAASKGIHEELGHTLAELTPIVNMAFFSLAGASLILVGSSRSPTCSHPLPC